MQQSPPKTPKEHLKSRYNEANQATQIALEKNRLNFLQKCLVFKRPPQSLRVRGLSGMPDGDDIVNVFLLWEIFLNQLSYLL